jgi:aerobic-type carbon monoxide dehydrogenase small subunit (CoxS/CutS family)
VVPPEGAETLLDALRALGVRSVEDGCAPQGQCGCCTVLVDGAPRVACVTPVRRVLEREITTLDGLPAEDRDRWQRAFSATGASQCGFCTPGIIIRLEGLRSRGGALDDRAAVERALAAHLCRCTGWQTIVEASQLVAAGPVDDVARDEAAAGERASLELGAPQRVGAEVVLGRAGFAADTVPDGTPVGVPDPTAPDRWVVAADLPVQGRRTTLEPVPPIELPEGDWAGALRTSWVDPAYLETDCSWCEPGGDPAPPAANGGAFGGKRTSPLPAAARALADERGERVALRWSREDCARRSAKRPPVAGGMRSDGTGVLRVARTAGLAEAVALAAPHLTVEEVDVAGPPTAVHLRAAGWAEAVLLSAAAGAASPLLELAEGSVRVRQPGGGLANVSIDGGRVRVHVEAGAPLDSVVLRSYCIGAVHAALGWVCSEALAVSDDGEVQDLTVRSFGVLRAAEMPHVEVEVAEPTGPAVAVADAVFVATAVAEWRRQGWPRDLPTGTLPQVDRAGT